MERSPSAVAIELLTRALDTPRESGRLEAMFADFLNENAATPDWLGTLTGGLMDVVFNLLQLHADAAGVTPYESLSAVAVKVAEWDARPRD